MLYFLLTLMLFIQDGFAEARDPCKSSPCPLGDYCMPINDNEDFHCVWGAPTPAPDMLLSVLRKRWCIQDTNNCNDHGTCEDVSGDGKYTCVCQDGWTGTACDQIVEKRNLARDPCKSSPCPLGDNCVPTSDNSDFSCVWGAQTPAPDMLLSVLRKRWCIQDTNNCNDHGTCEDVSGDGKYTCVCQDGWTGTACDQIVEKRNLDLRLLQDYLHLRNLDKLEDLLLKKRSWDGYIDNLIALSKDPSGAAHVDKACIIGLDGGAKLTSDGHQNAYILSTTEAANIARAFKSKDFTPFVANGILAAGVEYQFLREEAGKIVYGKKKGNGAITMQASKTAIVIAHCPEGSQQGNANKAVGAIAESLEGLGM